MSIIPPTGSTSGTGTPTVSGAVDNTHDRQQFHKLPAIADDAAQEPEPLDPLDTNQFTQQLVQFAQVEQQMKSNDCAQLGVAVEERSDHRAEAYVGGTVVTAHSPRRPISPSRSKIWYVKPALMRPCSMLGQGRSFLPQPGSPSVGVLPVRFPGDRNT